MTKQTAPLYERRPTLFGLKAPGTPQTQELTEDVFEDFLRLKEVGAKEGIELAPLSTWRSFENQKNIWNKKARGETNLLADNGEPLRYETLSPSEILMAILRWSAFPGLSRHHWGTDLDVYDEHTLTEYLKDNPSYKVQLIPSEYERGGPFEKLGAFLKENLKESAFFRPYEMDLGGVAREPWHLSHQKSQEFFKEFSYADFLDFLNSPHCAQLELISVVKNEARNIYENYFLNISNGL